MFGRHLVPPLLDFLALCIPGDIFTLPYPNHIYCTRIFFCLLLQCCYYESSPQSGFVIVFVTMTHLWLNDMTSLFFQLLRPLALWLGCSWCSRIQAPPSSSWRSYWWGSWWTRWWDDGGGQRASVSLRDPLWWTQDLGATGSWCSFQVIPERLGWQADEFEDRVPEQASLSNSTPWEGTRSLGSGTGRFDCQSRRTHPPAQMYRGQLCKLFDTDTVVFFFEIVGLPSIVTITLWILKMREELGQELCPLKTLQHGTAFKKRLSKIRRWS